MFKINYELKKINEVEPFIDKDGQKYLTWYSLTDGTLWINVGNSVIYEYSEFMLKKHNRKQKYNDYYIAKFLKDTVNILPFIQESIPNVLYESLEYFQEYTNKWESQYEEKSDQFFNSFMSNSYIPFIEWFYDRTIDSGHLVDGPIIGFFRCEDNIKILWNSSNSFEKDNSIWKYPNGIYEMKYDDFYKEIRNFITSYLDDIDKNVLQALKYDFKQIFIDKDKLVKENELQKKCLSEKTNADNSNNHMSTDWSKIIILYNKMIKEIKE